MTTINYKILLLGEYNDRISIKFQFIHGFFTESYDSTVEDIFRKNIDIDGKNFLLEIFDLDENDDYLLFRETFIKMSNGYVISFPIISTQSFLKIKDFRNIIYKVLNKEQSEYIPIILLGTKCELENQREVKKKDAEKIAENWGIKYMEVSAKENINISEAFIELVRDIEKQKKQDIKSRRSKKCVII